VTEPPGSNPSPTSNTRRRTSPDRTGPPLVEEVLASQLCDGYAPGWALNHFPDGNTMSSIGLDVHRAPHAALGATAHRRGQCADRNSPCPCQRSPRGTAECPMTVTAVGSPVTAEAFVIASEPAPGLAAGCRTALRGGAEDRPEPAYLYSMRRWRPWRDANIRQGGPHVNA
jgi:hypothetical protein